MRKKQTIWKNIDAQTFHSKAVLLHCRNEAEKSGSSAPTLEPWQNPTIQTLIQERRGCRDKNTESNVVKTDSETFASQYEAEKKQTLE